MITFFKFIPSQLTFLLIFGILIGKHFQLSANFIIQILVLLTLFLGWVNYYSGKNKIQTSFFTILFFIITFFIGVASITFQKAKNKTIYFGNVIQFKNNSNPIIYLQITKILKSSNFYNKYEAKVFQVDTTKTTGKILINTEKDSIKSAIGMDDILVTKSQIKSIPNIKNPHTFNYKKYLADKQIFYQLFLSKQFYKKSPKQELTINGVAFFIRNEINKALKKNGFKNEELAVINALLLGQRNYVSSDLLKNYARAGAIHILAVSGLHIGILLWALMWLFKPLRYFKKGKAITLLLVVLLLWVYACIAGLSASVVRAVAMFTAIAVSLYVNRLSNIYNTLVISMFFLLILHPFYLFDVGFQLSYLAVFAIVWLQPKLYGIITLKSWIFDKIWQLFTVSIAAQIGILPLSIFYFHQFPGLFFVANLVIIPFLGIILIAGIFVVILSLLGVLPDFLASGYNFIIYFINQIVYWVANQHLFLIQDISLSFVLMIAFYILILVTFKWIEKKNFKRLILVLISIIFVQSTLIIEKYKRQVTIEFIVFNKSKKSIIGIRKGENLAIYSSDNILDKQRNPVHSFIVGENIKNLKIWKEKKQLFNFNKERILFVDSLGLYPLVSVKPSIIVLQKSPKINLDRLVSKLHPSVIIADGSNFNLFKQRWSETCKKMKTPFYDTNKKGAFILSN
jgi:competence protein ComEC